MSEGHEPAVPCAEALYLETLHHARHNLMLQATVLSFCILSDGNEVDIIVPASSEYAWAYYIVTASSTMHPFQKYAQASSFAACWRHKRVATICNTLTEDCCQAATIRALNTMLSAVH